VGNGLMFKKMHIILCLFVALLVMIINIVKSSTLLEASVSTSISILLTYLIGVITKYYIENKIFPVVVVEEETVEEINSEEINLGESVYEDELEFENYSKLEE
jgi:Na+/H+-translocating membrane pyrophosphatase